MSPCTLYLIPLPRYCEILAENRNGQQVAQLSLTKRKTRSAVSRQTAKFSNSHVTITTPLLWVICHPIARIDMCTKFDEFRFSRSSNMIGATEILEWVTLPNHYPITDGLSSVGCDLRI